MGRMLVVLNAKAGMLLDFGAAAARAEVERVLRKSGHAPDVVVTSGADMQALIREAPGAGYDTVVIGAGDGTLSYAASVYANTDVRLGILPLGTMNLLAYDIGLPRDLAGALQALVAARPMRVDLGMLNGRPFHGVSGVGFFSQMARAREEVRETRGRVVGWFMALGKALLRTGRMSIEVEITGVREPIEAYAALVTVNAFDAPGWHRSRLDGGLLEVLVAEDRGTLSRLRTGADVLVGAWRNAPGIRLFTARSITIHARRHRTWVATDGEVSRESLPLRYAIAPGALTLLMPPAASQWRTRRREDIT